MKMMRVELASPPDRERLVAPIMIGDEQWAEVNREEERLRIEIYPCRSGSAWVFDFEETISALLEARERLRGR